MVFMTGNQYTFDTSSENELFRVKEIITEALFESNWFVSCGRIAEGILISIDKYQIGIVGTIFGILPQIYRKLSEKLNISDPRGYGLHDFVPYPLGITNMAANSNLRGNILEVFKVSSRKPIRVFFKLSNTPVMSSSMPSRYTLPALTGGSSVRASGSESHGTLSAVFNSQFGPVVLTNQHVVYTSSKGDAIEYNLNNSWPQIADYEDGILANIIVNGREVGLDAAISRLNANIDPTRCVIQSIGSVKNFDRPVLGEQVQKFGATSSLTHGSVSSLDVDVKTLINGKKTLLRNQIQIDAAQGDVFQMKGDSGSLLLNTNTVVLGILHSNANRDATAYASPWSAIESAFGLTF